MPSARVELVRGVLAAWNRRDRVAFDDFLTTDAVWVPAGPAAVEGATYRGKQEIADALFSVWEIWNVFEFEETEVVETDSHVLWLGHANMVGAASGVSLRQEWAIIASFLDDRIARVHALLSWDEARAAAAVS